MTTRRQAEAEKRHPNGSGRSSGGAMTTAGTRGSEGGEAGTGKRSRAARTGQKIKSREETTMKCAICGEEIKGKGKKLADGNTVCGDCYESSAMIVTCEECGGELLATNALKDDGSLYCMRCFRELVLESDCIGEPWEDWQEERIEEGLDAGVDEWARYMNEYLEDGLKEYPVTRIWAKTVREEVAKIVEAARKVAA
jgi:ribosomal protein S27E